MELMIGWTEDALLKEPIGTQASLRNVSGSERRSRWGRHDEHFTGHIEAVVPGRSAKGISVMLGERLQQCSLSNEAIMGPALGVGARDKL